MGDVQEVNQRGVGATVVRYCICVTRRPSPRSQFPRILIKYSLLLPIIKMASGALTLLAACHVSLGHVLSIRLLVQVIISRSTTV
jgi:hypothetical protein